MPNVKAQSSNEIEAMSNFKVLRLNNAKRKIPYFGISTFRF
jgi:hypothetical protein